jgi:alcohol dehydrogenase
MQEFTFHIPTKIIFGAGKIKTLSQEIPEAYKSILVVTDQNLRFKTDIIKNAEAYLVNFKVFIFDKIEENPSIESIDVGAQLANENGIDLVLGIGGGSSMDAAKGIALLAKNKAPLKDYLNGRTPENEALPLLCIPTTAGTGSEATPFAVFTDKQDESKKGYSHPSIFPMTSIIDPELTYSMPKNVRINTGLDVLAHSVEAYLSLESNILNDQIALESINLVIENLLQAVNEEKSSISNMAYSSVLAGIAITHASTILPHVMGYPLTVFHQIPHGRASILTLAAFLNQMENIAEVQEKVKILNSIFQKVGGLVKFLNSLGVSAKLSDYGINETEIDLFVEKSIFKGDVAITPGSINRRIIKQIYQDSL